MGSIYRDKHKDGTLRHHSWMMKYYQHGRPIRRSTHTTDEADARKILAAAEAAARHTDAVQPSAKDVRRATQTVNVDFPVPLLARIDRVVARLGIPRQAWIKLRLADLLAREE
jgi:hypothetical protein